MGPLTTSMRCAVHTFQLAICNFMKDHSIQGILSKARKVNKLLSQMIYVDFVVLYKLLYFFH